MLITAHGFAMPVKEAFAPVLKLRKWLNPVSLVPGWQNAASRCCSVVWRWAELAVLVVIWFHEEPENECVYPPIRALVLYTVAPLLSGITRVARAVYLVAIGRACCPSTALSNCSVVRPPAELAGFFA